MKKIKIVKSAKVNAKPSAVCDWAVDDFPMNKK
jgi:hypothetical protein